MRWYSESELGGTPADHVEGSPVGLDQRLCQREAQPVAVAAPAVLEHVDVTGDPRALVGDRDLTVIAGRAHTDRHRSGAVLAGVVDQDVECLAEPAGRH